MQQGKLGYVLEVENLAEFPRLLRVQEVDFAGVAWIILEQRTQSHATCREWPHPAARCPG
jgi:hypothetical protein